MRALVRDEIDKVEAERGPRRRQYIDERVTSSLAAKDDGAKQIRALDERIGQMQTELSIVARKVEQRVDTGATASAASRPGPAPSGGAVGREEFEKLRGDTAAALGAVRQLGERQDLESAQASARFERLELRTRDLEWPEQDGRRAVHLASYRSHEEAQAGWEKLSRKYGKQFAGLQPMLVEVDTVAGPFVRLMVGVGAEENALARVRDQLRAAGEYAMILAIPSRGRNGGPDTPGKPRVLAPGS